MLKKKAGTTSTWSIPVTCAPPRLSQKVFYGFDLIFFAGLGSAIILDKSLLFVKFHVFRGFMHYTYVMHRKKQKLMIT